MNSEDVKDVWLSRWRINVYDNTTMQLTTVDTVNTFQSCCYKQPWKPVNSIIYWGISKTLVWLNKVIDCISDNWNAYADIFLE